MKMIGCDMIQVSHPVMLGREREYILDCVDNAQLSSTGKYVHKFEESFAEFCGTRHSLTCSSGTAGLHLALLALDIGPGDKVFLPALTYIATANAVRYCGAEPVFCDIDKETWCLDPDDVEEKLAKKNYNRAVIMPVHLYGVMADMKKFKSLAEEYGAFIVEDAAEAHGAELDGQRAGSFGDVGVFSFYGNKILTCGEGGMVVTDKSHIVSQVQLLRGQGQTPGKRYHHSVIGYNYRMTNLQAAIGLAQLEMFTGHKSLRKKVMGWYQETQLAYVDRQVRPEGSADWMFSVLLPQEWDREKVMRMLLDRGIETRPVFPLVTSFPMYFGSAPRNSKDISDRGISLPTHELLTQDDVEYISQSYFEVIRAV